MISKNFYEYSSAADPVMIDIPIQVFDLDLIGDKSGWIPFDLSAKLTLPYAATGPSLLAGYIHVEPNTSARVVPHASAVFCCVVRGTGRVVLDTEAFELGQYDVLSLPGNGSIDVFADDEPLTLYSVNDSPLLHRLRVKPACRAFAPLQYKAEDIFSMLRDIDSDPDAANRNRDALIYGHPDVTIGKGMSPTVWGATVQVNPGEDAMPHKHNSIAIDIALDCEEGAFSRLGWKLNDQNEIIEPIEVPWKTGSAFVTPPGIWHSHHNTGTKRALVTAVQDATLHEYLQTLDIQFTYK
jgi:gentisate 1,2-dioxygenase